MATFRELPVEIQNCTDPKKFVLFYEHNRSNDGRHVFSQFYPCQFVYEDKEFCCAEQWMMYQKAITMNDLETAKKIALLGHGMTEEEFIERKIPHQIKGFGRKVKNWDQKKWDEIKNDVVYQGNLLKFSQNPELKKILLDTEDKILVESAKNDPIWGIGIDRKDVDLTDKSKWGENRLGCALMLVKDTLFKNN